MIHALAGLVFLGAALKLSRRTESFGGLGILADRKCGFSVESFQNKSSGKVYPFSEEGYVDAYEEAKSLASDDEDSMDHPTLYLCCGRSLFTSSHEECLTLGWVAPDRFWPLDRANREPNKETLLGLAASRRGVLLDLVDRARAQGWMVEQTKSGHWKFIPLDKTQKIVVGGGSGGDPRAWKNLEAQLKRSGFRGLGSSRRGWDAARGKQQRYTSKTYKPGPFDHWTDEELWAKVNKTLFGPNEDMNAGAWFDLDRAYSLANGSWKDADKPRVCYAQRKYIERATDGFNLARRIYNTGRLTRFVKGQAPLDWNMVQERFRECYLAYERFCGQPYDGPRFP